jgi:hypothetical protein
LQGQQERWLALTDGKAVADKALAKAVERVPEGPLKRALKQAGPVGLVLGVLAGNVPVSAAIAEALDGKVVLDTNALGTYWYVFVIVTPFVVVTGLTVFLLVTDQMPEMPGWAIPVSVGLLFLGAAWLSLELGGAVPLDVLSGPTSLSPGGSAEYVLGGLGDYLDIYGPWPILAGVVEGCAFGAWAAALTR